MTDKFVNLNINVDIDVEALEADIESVITRHVEKAVNAAILNAKPVAVRDAFESLHGAPRNTFESLHSAPRNFIYKDAQGDLWRFGETGDGHMDWTFSMKESNGTRWCEYFGDPDVCGPFTVYKYA